MDDNASHRMKMNMDFIEIQTHLSGHSSFSSIGDDRSLDLNDELLEKIGPSPSALVEEDSLNLLTILASSSFEIEMPIENSFDIATFPPKGFDVPSQITTHSSRKRTISQHDETATTLLSSWTFGDGLPNRPRFNSEGPRSSGTASPKSLSQSQLSIRDVASMLGSLSILDSSEQLKNPSFHHRMSCDQLPDAEELSKLGEGVEKSHRRNTQVVLIPTTASAAL